MTVNLSDMSDLVRLTDAARLLGTSRRSVYLAIERGEIDRHETPLGWLYSRAQLEALARRRAATLELTGRPGRPRRRPPSAPPPPEERAS